MRIAKSVWMAALFVAPFTAQLNAQSLQANIAGSTAFWLEAGEAAYTLGGTTTTCAWTTTTAIDGSSFVIDQRVPPIVQYFPFSVDYGALWVTWTTGSTGTCPNPIRLASANNFKLQHDEGTTGLGPGYPCLTFLPEPHEFVSHSAQLCVI